MKINIFSALTVAALLLGGCTAKEEFREIAPPPEGELATPISPNQNEYHEKYGLGVLSEENSSGRYKEAYEKHLSALRSVPAMSPAAAWHALNFHYSASELRKYDDMNEFINLLTGKFASNIYVLARFDFSNVLSCGYWMGGEFKRGYPDGNVARRGSAASRDMFNFLNLFKNALPAVEKCSESLRGEFYLNFLRLMAENRSYDTFHILTPLDGTAPEIKEIFTWYYRDSGVLSSYWQGAEKKIPFDASSIRAYKIPASFADAVNDGERIRFLVDKCVGNSVMEGLDCYASILASRLDVSWNGVIGNQLWLEPEKMREALAKLEDSQTLLYDSPDTGRTYLLTPDTDYFSFYRMTRNYPALVNLYCAREQFPRALELIDKALADKKSLNPAQTAEFESLKSALTSPGGAVTNGMLQVQDAGKAEISVPFRYRNISEVRVDMYKVDASKAFAVMLANLRKGRGESERVAVNMFDMREYSPWKDCVGEKLSSQVFQLKTMPDHRSGNQVLKFANPGAGAYFMTFNVPGCGKVSAETLLWVSGSAVSVIPATKGHVVTLHDTRTSNAVAGRKVTAYRFMQNYVSDPDAVKSLRQKVKIEVKTLELTTDSSGAALIPHESEFISGNGFYMFYAEGSGGTSFLPNVYLWRNGGFDETSGVEDKTFIVTDRPVYKPGDRLYFTIYPRCTRYVQKKFTPVKDINVKIYSPRGDVFMDWKKFAFDPVTGSASGEVELPVSAPLGRYTICSDPSGEYHSSSSGFTVEEYKKPEYVIDIKTPEKPLSGLGEFTLEAVARYHFGTPMRNAEVRYEVNRSNASVQYPFFGRYNWIFGRWYTLCSSALRFSYENRYNSYGSVQIASGTAVTDDEGVCRIKIDPSLQLPKGTPPRDYDINVKLSVTDSSNRPVSSSSSVRVTGNDFNVFLRHDKGYYRTADVVTFDIASIDSSSNPVPGKGRLEIRRRLVNASGIPETEKEPVASFDFETRAGEDFPKVRFVPEVRGVYEIAVTCSSAATSKSITEKTYMFVSGETESDGLFSPLPLELVRDKTEYAPGDRAKIIVSSSVPDALVYIFARSERKCSMTALRLENGSAEYVLDITRDDMPNTYVTACMYKDSRIQSENLEIPVPPENRALEVKVTPLVSKASPGDEIPVSVSVTDSGGAPVSGAAVITVYDKALEQIHPYEMENIAKYFWGWRRGFYSYGTYCSMSYYTHVKNLVNILAPESNRYSFCFGDSSRLMTTSKAPRHYSFRADKSKRELGKKEDIEELGMEMDSLKSTKRESQLEGFDSWAGASLEGVAVRREFSDRAFWCAGMVLDADGKAAVKVKAPENLTTWKVRVWSLTETGSVGEGESEFVVTKDILCRVELPRFAVQGDKFTAVANLHNLTDKPLKVKTLFTTDGKSVVNRSPSETEKVIPAHGDVSQTYTLEVSPDANEGNAQMILRMLAENGKSDAVSCVLPVVARKSPVFLAAGGRLSEEKHSAGLRMEYPRAASDAVYMLRLSSGMAKNFTRLLPYAVHSDSLDVFGVATRLVPAAAAEQALGTLGVKFEDLKLKADSYERLHRDYIRHPFSRPLFEPEMFKKTANDSARMLDAMQNTDGGWGWFGAYSEESYPDTSAYVLDSLLDLKKLKKYDFDENIRRGLDYLSKYAAFRASVIAEAEKSSLENGMPNAVFITDTDAMTAGVLAKGGVKSESLSELSGYLFKYRRHLSPYGLVMLAGYYPHDSSERRELRTLLSGYVEENPESGTAYLRIPDSHRFMWSGNETETLSRYIRFMLSDEPGNALLPKMASYLVTNILNSPWNNSPRELGEALKALSEYVVQTSEAKVDLTANVFIDGVKKHSFVFNESNLWDDDTLIAIPAERGREIRIETSGRGALHYRGELSYMSREKEMPSYGREMKVERRYYLVTKDASGVESRKALGRNPALKAGDEVEVELIVKSDNDYDYVSVSDSLPSGFEYTSPQSGYTWQWGAPVYCEFRERGPVFYLRSMLRGRSNMVYRVRAQLDGSFTILPASGRGLFAVDLKCGTSSASCSVGADR